MSDFAPPVGPPPPPVPEGWKAVWNDQYKEYFYVNLYTKQSQWDKPTSPVYPPGEAPPPGPPPPSHAPAAQHTNNPYAAAMTGRPSNDMSEDERLARKLQAEEEARARGHSAQNLGVGGTGTATDYYNRGPSHSPQPGYGQQGGYPPPVQYGAPSPQPQHQQQQQQQPQSKAKGLLGKLMSKASSRSSSKPHGYGQQQYYGGAPHGPGYGHAPMGYGAPYGHGGRRPGGGLGPGGAAALGVGGGLLAGGMMANAMNDDDVYVQNNYYGDEGGSDYGGGSDGGDFGGGDFDGGDMGGDF